MEVLLRELSKYEAFTVTGTDYNFDTFYDFAMSKGDIECNTALIIGDLQGDIPVEEKIESFLKKVTEIRFNRPQLRFIVSLPKSYEHLKIIQQSLVSLTIYDLHFTDQIQFDTLIDWLENPKNISDMREFIAPTEIYKQPTTPDSASANNSEEKEQAEKKDVIVANESSRVNRRKQRSEEKEIRFETKVVERIVSVTQKNIAFISNSRGGGSTFHATNFASFLNANELNVGLYESPIIEKGRTYLTDLFDLSDSSVSIPHLIFKNQPIQQDYLNKYNGITIYPVHYRDESLVDFTDEMMYRYLNIGRHTVKIADLGYWELNNYSESIIQTFDHIYLIVDLSPIAFIPNFERFEWLKTKAQSDSFPTISFIINPYVSSFPKNELRDLDLNKAYRCELFVREQIMEAYFNKQTAYDGVEEIQEGLNGLYQSLCKELDIPLYHLKKNKKTGIFNKLSLF